MIHVAAGWLAPLARRCGGFHRHGKAPTQPGTPHELLQTWARLVADSRAASGVELGGREIEHLAGVDVAASEALWVNELVGGLRFRPRLARRVPRTEHINVRELQAVRQVLSLASRQAAGPQRVLIAVDSLVTRGVVAKGRSASTRLNAEWSRCLPVTLGQGIVAAPFFVPTRLNPADGPSRLCGICPPKWPLPEFAKSGDAEQLEAWQRFPKQRRDAAPWARLVLRLTRFRDSPRAGRIFDATRGFPGEGPRPQRLPLERRPAVDLLAGPGRCPEVQERRARAALELRQWLVSAGVSWSDFLALPPPAVSLRLAAFGQWLYNAGRPHGAYVEAVNAAVDARPELRGQLVAAWRAAWAWRGLVPAMTHRPCPAVVLRAAAAVSLLYGRRDLAATLLVGFRGS